MGEEKTIDEIVDLLDNFSKSETSRMKVKVSEELPDGTLIREYHQVDAISRVRSLMERLLMCWKISGDFRMSENKMSQGA